MSKVKKLFNRSSKGSTGSDSSIDWSKHDERLALAVEKGDLDKIRELMSKKGVSATKLDPQGNTCLHRAAVEGKLEVIAVLLQHKADPNALDQEGRNALHCAVRSGHKEVAERLVEAQSDLETVDRHKLSTLHHACMSGNVECVEMLLNNGAPAYLQDEDGRPPLFYAARMDHVPICAQLIDNGCNINSRDYQRKTAVIMGAEEGKTDVVEYLVNRGADISFTDNELHDAMWYARRNGHKNIVAILSSVPYDGVEADQGSPREPQEYRSSSSLSEDDEEDTRNYLAKQDAKRMSQEAGGGDGAATMDVDSAVVPIAEGMEVSTEPAIYENVTVGPNGLQMTPEGDVILEEETEVIIEEVNHQQPAPPKIPAPTRPPPPPPTIPREPPPPPPTQFPDDDDLYLEVNVPIGKTPAEREEDRDIALLPPAPPVPAAPSQEDLKIKLEMAMDENNRLQKRIELLESELDRFRALGELLKPMESQYTDSLQDEIQNLKGRLEDEQRQNVNLEDEIKLLREQLDTRPEDDRSAADADSVTMLRAEIDKLTRENDTLKERLMEQERGLSPLAALKPSISEKELNELANYQALQEAHEKEIKYFMDKFEKMDAEKDELAKKITENTQLEDKIDRLQDDINFLIENPDAVEETTFEQLIKDVMTLREQSTPSTGLQEKPSSPGVANDNAADKARIAELEEQVEAINEVIAHAQELKDENDVLRDSYENLKQSITKNEMAAAQDKEELMTWFKELESENTNLKDKNKALAEQLSILEEKLNEMAALNNSDEINAILMENQQLQQNNQNLSDTVERQSLEIRDMGAENSKYEQSDKEKAAEVIRLTGLLKMIENANTEKTDDLEKQHLQLQKSLSKLEEEIGDKEILIQNYRKLIEDNKNLNQEVAIVRDDLEKKNSVLLHDLEQVNGDNKRLKEQVMDLEKLLEDADKEDSGYDTLRMDQEGKEAEKDRLQEELRDCRSEISELLKKISDLEKDLGKSRKDNKEKDNSLEEAKTRVAELIVAQAVLQAKQHEMERPAIEEEIIVEQAPAENLQSKPPSLPSAPPPQDLPLHDSEDLDLDEELRKAYIAKLVSENETLKDDLASVEQILQAKEQSYQQAQKDADRVKPLEKELDAVGKDVTDLQRLLSEKEDELNRANAIAAEKEIVVDHAVGGNLESQPPSQKADDLHLGEELRRAYIAKLIADNENLQEELKSLEDRLDVERGTHKEETDKLALVNQDKLDEISALQRAIEELKMYLHKNIEDTEEDTDDLAIKTEEDLIPQTTPEYLKSHNDIGRETLDAQKKDAEQLREEIGEVRDSLESSKNDVFKDNMSLVEENIKLKKKIENLQKMCDSVRALEYENESLINDNDTLSIELSKLQRAVKERNTDNHDSQGAPLAGAGLASLASLHAENEELRKENKLLKEELEELKKMAQIEHARLMEEIETWKNEIELLKEENRAKVYAENAKLKAALKELTDELEERGGKNVVLVKAEELHELREELDRLRSRPASPVEDIDDSSESHLVEVIKELEADNKDLRLKLDRIENEDKDKVKQEEVDMLKTDRDDLLSKMKDFEGAVDENNQLRAERDGLAKDIIAVNVLVENLKAAAQQKEQLQQENGALQKDIGDLKGEVETLKLDKEKNDSLLNENTQLSLIKADLEHDIAKLNDVEKENEQLKKDQAELQANEAKIIDEVTQCSKQNTDLQTELAKLREDSSVQNQQLVSLQKEKERIEGETQALISENEDLIERFEELKQRSQERESQLHQENEQLMDSAETLQVEVEDQKAAAVFAEEEKKRTLDSNIILLDEIKSLREQLADNEDKLLKLEETNEVLQAEVEELDRIPKFTPEIERQMKELEEDLANVKNDCSLLDEEKKVADERCVMLKEELKQLAEVPKLTPQMEEERRELEDAMKQLQDSHSLLREKADTADSNCASLRDNLQKLEAVPKVTPEMEQERKDLEENLKQINNDMKQLAEKVYELDEVKAENGALKEELTELDKVPKYTPELKKERDDLENDVQRYKHIIEELSEKVEENEILAEDNRHLADKLKRAEAIPKLTQEMENERQELEDRVMELEERVKALDAAEQEIKRLKDKLNEESKIPRLTPVVLQEISSLKEKQKELEDEIASLEKQLRDQDEKAIKAKERLLDENKELQGEMESLTDEMLLKEKEKQSLASRVLDLNSTNEDLEDELEKAKHKIEMQEDALNKIKSTPLPEPPVIVKEETVPVQSAPPISSSPPHKERSESEVEDLDLGEELRKAYIAKLVAENSNLKDDMASLTENLLDRENALQQAQKNADDQANMKEALQSAVRDLNATIQRLNDELEEAEAKLSKQEQEIVHLQNQPVPLPEGIVKEDTAPVQSAPPIPNSPPPQKQSAIDAEDLDLGEELRKAYIAKLVTENQDLKDDIARLRDNIQDNEIALNQAQNDADKARSLEKDLNRSKETVEDLQKYLTEKDEEMSKLQEKQAEEIAQLKKQPLPEPEGIVIEDTVPVQSAPPLASSPPPQNQGPSEAEDLDLGEELRKAYIAKLLTENQELKDDIAWLKENVQDKEIALNQAQHDADKASSLEKELDRAKQTVDDLRKSLTDRDEELTKLQVPVEEKSIVIEVTPGDVQSVPPPQAAEDKKDTLPQTKDDKDLESLKEENNRLQNNLDALQKVLSDSLYKDPKENTDDIKNENKKLALEVEDLSKKLVDSVPSEKLRLKDKEIEELKKENDQLMSATIALKEANEKLKEDLQSLEHKLAQSDSDIRAENKRLLADVEKLEKKIEDLEDQVKRSQMDKEEMDEREKQLQHEQDLLRLQVKDITAERLDNLAQIEGLKERIDELVNILADTKIEKQVLLAENKSLRNGSYYQDRVPDNEIVAKLKLENSKLQDFLCKLESRLDKNRTPSSSRPGSGTTTPRSGTPVLSPRLGAFDMYHQVEDLERQLAEAEKRHKEIVATYRSHLLGAVQGRIDPEVKQALLHIVKLRDVSEQLDQ